MNKYAEHSQVDVARSCLRKKSYKTAEEAHAAMLRSGTKQYYKCRFCPKFHLTSQIPKTTSSRSYSKV